MQNNEVTLSFKLLILLLLSATILIAKSLYLILFITVFSLIIIILNEKSVNIYINTLKKHAFLLLFIEIIYIIVCGNIVGSFLFLYKLVLITILIKNIMININFNKLHSAIYTLLIPVLIFKIDLGKISFDITESIYFIKYFMESKRIINQLQDFKNKRKYNLKHFWVPRLLYSNNKINLLNVNLEAKFYKLNKEKINIKSYIFLTIFIVIFIIALFKEVIL